MSHHLSRVLIISLSLTACCAWSRGGDWPQWRGPTRDGQVRDAAWPSSLSTNNLTQSWRVELGPSYSGPIVSGGLVFTTETVNKKTEVVRAFDRATGKQAWQVEWEGSISVPFFAKSSGDWIRSTPACDGESLFVAGMRDMLVCLDARTGQERWRFDFVKKLAAPVPDFGFVCSPLVDGEAVYVQAGAGFAKLNKQTGALLWHTLKDQGGMFGSAFSSPIIAELCGKRQLIVQTREQLAGVDLASGSPLWTQHVAATRGMNILTPVPFGDGVFTSAYGGKTWFFRVSREGEAFKVAPAWSHKAQGYMCTPVVINGVAYEQLRSQHVMAVDLNTGKELWTTGESFGKYWSLVANGDRILALDQRGWLYLFNANPDKFDLVDKRKIADAETWAHLGVAGDQLFIRELKALAVWRWGAPATPVKAQAAVEAAR
ncbi:MAG: PQQ-binding-like beta-propeller repeat protein [Verrucomicrobia bacterium]|nr:PQQ-binding-like beta-propeller repeat protein [Verrucomicrobiota bacterium]